MTKCTRYKVNLKSSTYNQTGQSSFEQLEAYNSMSIHLRRILLAKSVVDARNKDYLSKKNQRYKVQETGDKTARSHPKVIDDVIDILAYDTQNHPMDLLRMNLNPKHLHCCNYNLSRQQFRVCSDQAYREENDRIDRRSASKNRRTTSPATTRSPKRKRLTPNSVYGKESKCMREFPHVIGSSTSYSQRRKRKYEKDLVFDPATTLDSAVFKSGSQSLIQEVNDHRSISSNASQCYDYDCDDQSVDSKFVSKQLLSQKLLSQKEEEKKYVKFIYDITREIIEKGLYTDKELQNIFKKHIDRYKGILSMNKMLYEIYQLKISLNMTDDSDTDDELEDLIYAQKLLTVSEIRPPTPPKVLNENKVMEKLESYREMTERSRVRRTVTLVDANPDLLVTERDVLISLIEVGIDPKQVQNICKNLRYKSRDPMQITAKASKLSLDLETDERGTLEELRNNDEQISPTIEMIKSVQNSVADISPTSSDKQEDNFSNLASAQQDTVETEEKIESETTLENDKVES